MALNIFMHPRNIYKTPPDFSKLAKNYPEFQSVSKTDASGKVTIDFKDPKSLRILTRCLLKCDFHVDINIPEDRLVPTLPLRLNYILWIEDIMTAIDKCSNISGIDIGTGACAIFPILGSIKNKWKMLGTDTDEKSLQEAKKNIEKNDLQNYIKLYKNSTSKIISSVLDSDNNEVFDFCMCNPPFYSSMEELYESRDPTRQQPKNGFTGSPQELITEGGELTFCKKLIAESKIYKDKICIYTTMIGHKYHLKELMEELHAEGIKFTHTEFCQGRITRWGLAWTHKEYNIYKLVPPREKSRKKNKPMSYMLPQLANCDYSVETYSEKMKSILQKLKMSIKIVSKRSANISMQLTALENTWSHQRRKRRLLKKIEACEEKKRKISNTELTLIKALDEEGNVKELRNIDDCAQNNNVEYNLKDDACQKDVTKNNTKVPLVQAFMNLLKKDNDILFQVEYLNGTAGKEGLHQIVQYIKNNWK